ncbi:5166_t:CDS:2, partial [Acaulospora colombiana]
TNISLDKLGQINIPYLKGYREIEQLYAPLVYLETFLKYNTEASYIAAHALASQGQKADGEETGKADSMDAMANAEKAATKGPSFVRATTTAKLPQVQKEDSDAEIKVAEGNEEEIQMSEEE